MRWPSTGHCFIDDYQVYSGNNIFYNSNENAVVVSKLIAKLKIEAKPTNTKITVSYISTAQSTLQELKTLYHNLQTATKIIWKFYTNIVLRDFNATVINIPVEEITG